jgi:XTP/dITP diphosphohydrolase
MTRVVLATRNTHKVSEIAEHLAALGIQVDGLGPDLPAELPETGHTFEENALQKARFVHQATGLPALADDSGIEVDALGGAPGVYSRRFAPENPQISDQDAANNAHLLALLDNRPVRTARYRCVLALVGLGPDLVVTGACEGVIGTQAYGTGGFGYDPLFWPTDAPGRTMAQLSPAEKHAISHRGRALLALAARLAEGRP